MEKRPVICGDGGVAGSKVEVSGGGGLWRLGLEVGMAGQMSHMKLLTPHFSQLACKKRGVKEGQSPGDSRACRLVGALRFVLMGVEGAAAVKDVLDGDGERISACTMTIGSPFARFSHRWRTGSWTKCQGALRERRTVGDVSLSPQPGAP